MKQQVVIIGAGLGGLFTGAILAKEGYQVTVLEKNATIGGGLQTFTRWGQRFDTGMHVIGGMQPGGNIRRICNYLGILDEVQLRDVDEHCSDALYFAEDDAHYTIARGREGFVRSLAAVFPHEREGLRRYVDAIYTITDHVDQFNLRPSHGQMSLLGQSNDFLMPADEFIAQHVGDRRLRSVLAYMNPLYGGQAHCTPAYIHAIISVLYIDGTSRFVDGSSHFADSLAGVITRHDGVVLPGDGVEWIEVNNRHIDHVRTRSGRCCSADHYICAMHPCSMLRLMDAKALPKAYCDRLNSIPNAYSAFSLYIKFKPNSFAYINHSEYYMTRYDDIWNFADTAKQWPLGFLFMTPPDAEQGEYASKALVTAPMTFDHVKPWENTTVEHRGEDYRRWKDECAARLLAMIERLHPGISDCIDQMLTASPLTIRDFYAVKGGSLSGYVKDCHNMALSQVPVVTKIDNLLLTGQNNNLHGFCGVPLTAILTCEALLGNNYVINKINACDQR